jgi:hypothetical protein
MIGWTGAIGPSRSGQSPRGKKLGYLPLVTLQFFWLPAEFTDKSKFPVCVPRWPEQYGESQLGCLALEALPMFPASRYLSSTEKANGKGYATRAIFNLLERATLQAKPTVKLSSSYSQNRLLASTIYKRSCLDIATSSNAPILPTRPPEIAHF